MYSQDEPQNETSPSSATAEIDSPRARSKTVQRIIAASLISTVLLTGGFASADEKARKIVGGILKILVESQMRDRDGQNIRPGGPRPGRATPELTKARTALQSFRQESITLNTLLQKDAQRNPGLRTLIADSVRLQARADAITQRSQAVPDHRFIVQDTRLLDSDWRKLSWRLQQVPNLPQPCRACIGLLDRYDAAFCEALSIEPQIDRRSLQRQSEGLVVYLNGLGDDINFELQRSPARNTLLLKASQAHQSAVGFSDAVSASLPYSELVSSYKSFLRRWNPLARELCSFESRFIERTVLRLQQIDQSIHELLWLPRGVDRDLLIQLTRGINVEVNRILDTVTLRILLELPNSSAVPDDAASLIGLCEHFEGSLQVEEEFDEIVEAYSYLPSAWVAFSRHFRALPHDGIRQSLSEIEKRLVALREPLGIPGGFDADVARQRAGAIERLADHLHTDVEAWLRGEPKYATDRKAILEHCAHFRTASRQLHASLVHDTSEETLRKHCNAIYAEWEVLHRHIVDCRAPGGEHINELLIQISTELIEIEAMFL